MRDPVDHGRRAAGAGGLRGGAARRRTADRAARHRAAPRPRSSSSRATSSSTGWRPRREWAAENADVRIAIMADVEHARAVAGRPEEAGARAEGAQAADGDVDAARGRGRATAGRSRCSPRTRTRARRACRCPTTRTSTTRPAWRPTATRSPPGSASPSEAKRLAEWIQGKEEVHIQAPGTDITLGVAGRTLDPLRAASTTCPTASSSPARSRTR